MTARLRRTVIVSVAALVVAVTLVWAATTQPERLVGSESTSSATPSTDEADPTLQQTPETTPDRSDGDSDQGQHSGAWLRDVTTFLLLLVALWFGGLVLRALVLRIAAWLPEKRLVADLVPLPGLDGARETLAADEGRHQAALAGDDVRNGIVACWVLLEETAATAGVARLPAETSTEFVVRFLHALDVDPRPVATLAGLYREARFSSHALPDDTRARAEAALSGIHRELDRAGAR